ncbi:DUF4097 family beta strand repeat-containing protein [Bacillus sp. 1NLA3E]|uniref:DUF4097 family beta strand repeat-containing protein n=1 Tax=Bacillus sp. 1NLA3E TaxID=666686 RepID=UPI000247EE4C|nr:DUF4097 domain-containing protein [Bacillus sp. 1NLA3E]AGK55626.1 hypothetical protein B1NLA3E_19410 [Bacillus sp. 1NLA3E]
MQEERKRVLKLVEEGKLSAEEALSLLNDLDKSQQKMEKKQEELVNELSTVVKFDEEKKEEDSTQFKYQSLKDKIVDFVDSAFKKIKDFDLDFNFGQATEISHIFQHGDVQLRNIDIDVANGSVVLKPWDQSDVRIECKAKVYRASSQDEARASFLKDIQFNVELGTLRFAAQPKWMKVDAILYIPQEDYENVRVRLFNGPVQCENLNVKSLKMKTANGRIAAVGLNGGKLEAETANGKIKIQNSVITELEAETLNGAIQLEGDYSRVEMQSFNGNINCKLTGANSELIDVKTVTGSIELLIPEGIPVVGELKSNLGSFSVELDGIQIIEEKTEMVQKSLHFKPILTDKQPLNIDADTKTGSISVKKSFTMDFQK